MNRLLRFSAALGAALLFSLFSPAKAGNAEASSWIFGIVRDAQGSPVAGARVSIRMQGEILASAETQEDGGYALPVPEMDSARPLLLVIERPHFQKTESPISDSIRERLRAGESVRLPETVLARKIDAAFWISAGIFLLVLLLMATGKLHNTLAALVGAALIFLISYLGKPFYEGLYIFDFSGALRYIDWNVIFLVMGMMIVIAVVERTGIFQWLAFQAYRLSGGRAWLLMLILMILTGVVSAFLDNVTTMLLMTPITVQIAIALGINPLALLMPEVMASNVVGVSTLVGTPTNILIGSYGGISFNDFLIHLTPGVLLSLAGLIAYSEFVYRREIRASGESGLSRALFEKLEAQAKITEPEHLRKVGVVGAGMLVLFILGEHIHLVPAVTAIIGATALLVWILPDIEEMIEAVDWTTLVFFLSLFIVVGAIQEVGIIGLLAEGIGNLVGKNLTLAMLAVVWVSALLSTVIANIPFTAAMLPIIGYLSGVVPGAGNGALYYCLSVGSAMGGNGSLVGASANMVTAGVAGRAGYPISYAYFLKKGFPALLITVSLSSLWLLLHF